MVMEAEKPVNDGLVEQIAILMIYLRSFRYIFKIRLMVLIYLDIFVEHFAPNTALTEQVIHKICLYKCYEK